MESRVESERFIKPKETKTAKRVAVKQIEALDNSKVLLPEFS